jgi:crotonobetainyl-CoA:carnitine CoA-transferase CaiB-like acyl-CoA transferase
VSSVTDPQPGPLDGVRVLDLSRFIAGPLCGQLLGDMGAEVIKVERPRGEDAREQGVRFKGESLYTMAFNRNKFGITLDTRHPAAAEILERLIRVSDVLIENYRPGTLDTMGLGSSRLRELNPRLVVTSLSGFGQTGPLSGRTLFDPIAQAMSGLMALSGDPDGPPMLTGTYIADHLAGLYGAIGTLLALHARHRTGAGQTVDVASLDAVFSCLGSRPLEIAMLGLIPRRRGSRDPFSSPANVFRASDGYLYIHGGTDPLFPKLCAVIGQPDLATDTRFRDVASRMLAADELEASVSTWTESRTIAEASQALADAGIPFGPVAEVADAVASEQIEARGMLVEIEHPTLGPVVVTGLPIKLSETPGAVRKAPPRVGEDNDRIYGAVVGLSAVEIGALRSSGVI